VGHRAPAFMPQTTALSDLKAFSELAWFGPSPQRGQPVFLTLEVLFHRHGLLAGSKQESTAETAATGVPIVQPVQTIVAVALRVMPPLLAFTRQDTTVPTALTALQSPVRSGARE
jgi:hypothetical protein